MQISATSRRLSEPRSKPGRAARARAVNSVAAGLARTSANAASDESGTDSGGRDQVISPGMPRGSRLVVSTWTLGHRARTRPTRGATASRTCSQLSSTSNSSSVARTSTIESSSERSRRRRRSRAPATAATTELGSRTGASSTTRVPSPYSPACVPRISRAIRVLPTPPGPVRVTNRPRTSNPATTSSSSSRPTSELGGTGSASDGVLRGGGVQARLARSVRMSVSSALTSADGSSPSSSRSRARSCAARRSASAGRPLR